MRSLIAAFLLAFGSASIPIGEPDVKAIDDLLLRCAANGWSGSVLIAKNGKEIFAGGYSFASFDANRANDADTLFEIASISKSFTAVAVVKLAQQGKLALDDSIALRLPNVPEHSRKITLRHLLSHTSGIPRSNGSGRGEDLAKAVVDFLGAGPQSPPGSKYEYWNGGYALLAGVIERASGLSYTAYLEQELFAPAGMSDTGFTGDTDLDAARAAIGSAHDGNDRGALEHPYGFYDYRYRGMGGIVTTARDMLKWDRALAANSILDEAHTRELFTPVREGYALGWRVARAPNGSLRLYHGGFVRGFPAEFRRYPAENACIVVLCNRDDQNCGELADWLECLLFGRAFLTPPPKSPPLDQARAASCAGSYASPLGRIVVRAAAGGLMAGIEGDQLLGKLAERAKLDWKADAAELGLRATTIVEGLARGDAELLRKHLAKGIPERWPDDVVRTIWPEQVAKHGALVSVRSLGTRVVSKRLEVLLALEHANGPSRARIAFGEDGLSLLAWDGPAFPATARLQSQGKNAWQLTFGEKLTTLEFELVRGTVAAVKLAGVKLTRE